MSGSGHSNYKPWATDNCIRRSLCHKQKCHIQVIPIKYAAVFDVSFARWEWDLVGGAAASDVSSAV